MGEAATNEIGWRRGEHRKQSMVKMEVDCRPESQVLPNGNYVTKGKNTILVYQDQVEEVEAHVEPSPDAIELAKKKFEQLLRGKVRSKFEKEILHMNPKDPKNADKITAFIDEKVNEMRRITGMSPESIFSKDIDPEQPRAIKPLIDAKVLAVDIPPPPKADEYEKLDGFSRQLAEILAKNNEQLAGVIVQALTKKK